MSRSRRLNLHDRDDLSYLEGVVACAPRGVRRTDIAHPYTDWQRELVTRLIAIAKEHTECEAHEPVFVEPGADV